MTRAEWKAQARESLTGNWGLTIGVLLVEALLTWAAGRIVGLVVPEVTWYVMDVKVTLFSSDNVVSLLLGGPFAVGLAGFFLTLRRKDQEPRLEQLFDGFRQYAGVFLAGLIITVLVDIGLILLIVPGIILSLMFSQTYYILSDQPGLSGGEAVKASMAMMEGHKGEYFVLILSFIPWLLLCILIIPAFYVVPYMKATMAAYYEYLKEEQANGY